MVDETEGSSSEKSRLAESEVEDQLRVKAKFRKVRASHKIKVTRS